MVRYELMFFTNRGGSPDAKLTPANEGEWVRYEDYAALEAERDRLRAALEKLNPCDCIWSSGRDEPSERKMRCARCAALEGGDE